MRAIEKNTVDSKNQLQTSSRLFFENENGKGTQILFVGNSITLHGAKPELGWYQNCGMAASGKDKDYVHIVMSEILKCDGDAILCIAQISDWERDYKVGNAVLENQYRLPSKLSPDIIIFRLSENCPIEHFDGEVFYQNYQSLIEHFNTTKKAKIILTTSFWEHPADAQILRIGREKNLSTVYLGDLGNDEGMKAIGKFEHSGVAAHPGDKGMKTIAERILKAIEKK